MHLHAICEANGIASAKEIDSIIADCDGDLRRVKRRIHAITRKHLSNND